MPDKVVGMYLLVSDNKDHLYTDSHNWTPQLRPYQVGGFNALFLTFVDPASLVVPLAMRNLAAIPALPYVCCLLVYARTALGGDAWRSPCLLAGVAVTSSCCTA